MTALMQSYSVTQKGEDLIRVGSTLKPEVLNFLECLEARTGPEWFSISPALVSQLLRYNYITRVKLPEGFVYPKVDARRP